MRAIWSGAVGVIVLASCLVPECPGRRASEAAGSACSAPPGRGVGEELRSKGQNARVGADQDSAIICDMWNQHWCKGATRRVAELAPAMNRAVAGARDQRRADHPCAQQLYGRLRESPGAQACAGRAHRPPICPRRSAAGATAFLPRKREFIPSTRPMAVVMTDRCARKALPGGRRSPRSKSRMKTPSATRARKSGTCWKTAESRTSLLMGVHTNMCVLGRPFGLRNLSRHGKNVGPGARPDRHHVQLAELALCQPLRRDGPDHRAHREVRLPDDHLDRPDRPARRLPSGPRIAPCAVFLIGDDEYKTEQTLPAFANSELEPQGVRCTFVIADPKTPHDFKGIEALNDADLLVS